MTIEFDPALPIRAISVGGGGAGPRGSQTSGAGDNQALRDRKIMIVEDESVVALLMADAIEDAGASIVGPCYTVAECLRTARDEDIDAAVLDVDLAGEDVFPAAEALRRRGIPFLFHTAHAYRHELRAKFGDVAVCRKPTSMADLVAALSRVVGGAAAN